MWRHVLIVSIVIIVLSANAGRAAGPPFCEFSLKDGWSNVRKKEYITHKARPDDPSGVPQVIDSIKRAIDVKADVDVYLAEAENNCYATVAQGQKLLVVDVAFLDQVNNACGTKWGAIQILAHEFGHHIAGFGRTSHENELNADYWSGYILEKLGAARDASTKAILTVGTEVDTASHPNKHTRATVIQEGWDDAQHKKVNYNHCEGCR